MSGLLETTMAVPTLDLAATWGCLTPDAQRMLGMCVLAIGLARVFNSILPGELEAAEVIPLNDAKVFFDVGHEEGLCVIAGYIEKCILGGDIARLVPPSIAALGIRQCTGCGCTYDYGRNVAFTWATPTLCSQCVIDRGSKETIEPRPVMPY